MSARLHTATVGDDVLRFHRAKQQPPFSIDLTPTSCFSISATCTQHSAACRAVGAALDALHDTRRLMYSQYDVDFGSLGYL